MCPGTNKKIALETKMPTSWWLKETEDTGVKFQKVIGIGGEFWNYEEYYMVPQSGIIDQHLFQVSLEETVGGNMF